MNILSIRRQVRLFASYGPWRWVKINVSDILLETAKMLAAWSMWVEARAGR